MTLDFYTLLRSPYVRQYPMMPNFYVSLRSIFVKQFSTPLDFDVSLRALFAKQSPHTGKSKPAAFIGIGERILG